MAETKRKKVVGFTAGRRGGETVWSRNYILNFNYIR